MNGRSNPYLIRFPDTITKISLSHLGQAGIRLLQYQAICDSSLPWQQRRAEGRYQRRKKCPSKLTSSSEAIKLNRLCFHGQTGSFSRRASQVPPHSTSTIRLRTSSVPQAIMVAITSRITAFLALVSFAIAGLIEKRQGSDTVTYLCTQGSILCKY